MGIFQNILVFIYGAAAGSAANALIDRLPRNESWFKGRSHCDKCGHVLEWYDLIPILSYLSLKGKCRYCQSPIPFRNTLIEIFIGVGFLLIFNFKFSILNQGQILNALILCSILWVTTIIAVMDWETQLVSEILVILWGILILFLNFPFNSPSFIKEGVEGVLVAVGMIGGVWAISKGRAMGFGDVEIAAVMGFWLGWPKIVTGLWMAFVTGAIIGVIKLIKRSSRLRSQIAFGPFLVIGAWVGYLWGEKIISILFL